MKTADKRRVQIAGTIAEQVLLLLNKGKPLTASEMYEALRAKQTKATLAAVYHALHVVLDLELVDEVDGPRTAVEAQSRAEEAIAAIGSDDGGGKLAARRWILSPKGEVAVNYHLVAKLVPVGHQTQVKRLSTRFWRALSGAGHACAEA